MFNPSVGKEARKKSSFLEARDFCLVNLDVATPGCPHQVQIPLRPDSVQARTCCSLLIWSASSLGILLESGEGLAGGLVHKVPVM